MSSIQRINNCFYIVQKVRFGAGKWKNKYQKATEQETHAYALLKELGQSDIAFITCGFPDCDRKIAIPREQKRELNTTHPLRYNLFSLVYCSKQCQEAHTKDLEKMVR